MRCLLIVVAFIFLNCDNHKKDSKNTGIEEIVTTYYFIRHAEKDRSTTNDPELTEEGKTRAANWAKYFKDIEINAVYSTAFKRTQQTATPTAIDKSVPIQIYDAGNLYDTSFKEATKGMTVLVVGHSNTTPAFVNAIIGEKRYSDISDTENGMLYKVVVPEKGKATVKVNKVEM
jgi:2,3-bisphosphoglycerate-dependent phosphoglycerate mutase